MFPRGYFPDGMFAPTYFPPVLAPDAVLPPAIPGFPTGGGLGDPMPYRRPEDDDGDEFLLMLT